MSRRSAIRELALFALVACADHAEDGSCPGPNPGNCGGWSECDSGQCVDIEFYVCENGEWQEVICEALPVLPDGTWTMTQTIEASDASCPSLIPRDPLTFVVADDDAVSVEPPVVLLEATASAGVDRASVAATLVDDWNGTTPTLLYDLFADADGWIGGNATLELDGCTATIAVDGQKE